MKTTIILLTVAVVAWGQEKPAPPPKGAAGFASELSKLTGKYWKEVEKKLNAEEDAYEMAARLYASAHEQGVYESLAFEREGRAIRLAALMQDGRVSVSDFLFREVPDSAEADFQKTKVLFQQEMESHLAYLRGLADLTIESKKIAGLQSMFDDLAKKPNLADWGQQLAKFGDEFERQVKHSDCALTASRLPFHNRESARLDGLVKAAKAAAEQSGLDADEKKEKEKIKTRLESEKKGVDDKIAALTTRRAATGVFDATAKVCK